MNLITLDALSDYRDTVNSFGGLSLLESCGEGELSMDENMSDYYYPFLTDGGEKYSLQNLGGECMGLLAKEKLCAAVAVGKSACKLYYGGTETPLTLEYGKKKLVSMGTKIIIFPDKKYYDTYSGEYGSLESHFKSVEGVPVSYALTRADGTDYPAQFGAAPPVSPADGTYWCDTSVYPAVLKVYSAQTESFTDVESVFVKIGYPSIGEFFREGDAVEISGAPFGEQPAFSVISALDTDYIIVPGILEAEGRGEGILSVSRRVPEIDFVTESDNRLWACRYGLSDGGDFVNEIYASKLGDPFNWHCYEGISTDSYTASVGTDGPFTGVAAYLGSVLFFKENTLHKVYGTKPANFRITADAIRGVETGCEASLCIIDEILYYRSRSGIMAYDGAVPCCVSEKLGRAVMKDVMAERDTYNLYVSFADEKGVRQLYTYNPTRRIWHRLSPEEISFAVSFEGAFVYSRGDSLYAMGDGASSEKLSDMFGGECQMIAPEKWCFETGELGRPDKNCYLTKLHLKMKIGRGSTVRVRIKCDGRDYVAVGSLNAACERMVSIPVVTGRCSSLRAEISGCGKVILYSLGRTFQDAPDCAGGVI